MNVFDSPVRDMSCKLNKKYECSHSLSGRSVVIVQTRNSKWLLLFVTKLCVHCKNDQMAQGYLNLLSKSLSSQIVIE